jgi:drug/metabolite transporter (DMT)-like permease
MNSRAHSATPAAFVFLLLLAGLLGGSVIAARVTLDHGTSVPTAVAVRSFATAAVVGALCVWFRVSAKVTPRQARTLVGIGALLALQSLCLYGAVRQIPVGLAVLTFNTYPLWIALAARLLYGDRPGRAVLWAMPVILAGLALALNTAVPLTDGARASDWLQFMRGVGAALAASLLYALALVLTQHEVAALDGRLRSAATLVVAGSIAAGATAASHGPLWPADATGWWALSAMSLLYGSAITALFTVLPRLGVVGSSPVLSVEPVVAMGLAWLLLGQPLGVHQLGGALLVVATVMALGLCKR